MCLINIQTITDRTEIDCFKIFGIKNDGSLTSAFDAACSYHLSYTPNTPIRATEKGFGVFYCFSKFKDAALVAYGYGDWNFVSENRLILPVTLSDIKNEGYLYHHFFATQLLCYTGKEIIVHDNPENRRHSEETEKSYSTFNCG